MIARRSLLVVALIAGGIAGALYFIGAQRVPVVVAAHDIPATRALTALDVEVRSVPPEALPPGALADAADVIGRIPLAPLWRGQAFVGHALADEAPVFQTGLSLSPGERAIAIPVVAASAVGGAIAPGVRIDVLAVPLIGRAPAGRTVELLATDALVLDVRTESGAPYGAGALENAFGAERIGSVIIAISPADEIRFADRIATSTFVLAFSSSR
ncbi:MAG TPA: RcpC/CpaB family pilus assembly protein [Candidatus Limnocylindria bacterium]|nr:RcpC/CpaB family pilus assembly protein [Candidatus Limnocylindria bacterium]